jgi:putative inorganic carbon (hco3(-)) transporter
VSSTPSLYQAAPARTQAEAPTTPSVLLLLVAGLLIPALLAYGMATTNELRVLAVILGLIAVVVILAQPFWGLIFFVALLYIRPEETIPALQGMRLTLVISAVTFSGLLLRLLLNREPLVRSPLITMILGFTGAVLLSTLQIDNTVEAGQDISKLALLIILVLNLVRTPERYRTFVTAILIFSAYLALFSIYYSSTGGANVHQDTVRSQGTGIFNDPNDLASTIAAGLALCLTRVPSARAFGRVLYLMLAGIMTWAIFLTQSRGGMLALLVVYGGFCFVSTRRKGIALVLAAVLGMGLMAAGGGRMTQFDTEEESANSRFHFWAQGIDCLIGSPVTGVGYRQFPNYNEGAAAHNTFVNCFAEVGLLGYFFWIGCIYYCFRRRRRTRPGEPEDGRPIPLEVEDGYQRDLFGARLALGSCLFACFFLSRTYIPSVYLLICLPVVQQMATGAGPRLSYLTSAERWRDWGAIGGISIGSIFLIHVLAQTFQ